MFKHSTLCTRPEADSMPQRAVVARALSDLLGVLAHPKRVQIVEELRDGEKDVNTLQTALGISHSGVSQHLSLLRAHRLVAERRVGRHVFYSLRQPELARWMAEGMMFLEATAAEAEAMAEAIETVKVAWGVADREESKS